jgi:hypothetical protein
LALAFDHEGRDSGARAGDGVSRHEGGGNDRGWSRDGGAGSYGRQNSRTSNVVRSTEVRNRTEIRRSPRSVPKQFHRLNVAREHSVLQLPKRGPGGEAFHGSMVSPRKMNSSAVRSQMAGITRGNAFRASMNRFNSVETVRGHYYWHSFNGYHYCHYLDPWGAHWYGWYGSNGFFWTRYYGNYWWWYDPLAFHWCYWDDGDWWWQDPYTNVVYVENGGPSDSGPSRDDSAQGYVQYQSRDGSRTVKMVGQDAFLFDTSGDDNFRPVYLASGVGKVEFSYSNDGKPHQIMLVLNDGSFKLFDDQGQPSE